MAIVSKILGHGSISTILTIYAHVLPEHLEQFERQRARILGTRRASDASVFAEERLVAYYQWRGVEQPGSSSGS